jgi:hypothetical protein
MYNDSNASFQDGVYNIECVLVERHLMTVSATTPTTATGTSTARRMVWVVSSEAEFGLLLVGALVVGSLVGVPVVGALVGVPVVGVPVVGALEGALDGAMLVHSVCWHTPAGMPY